MCMIVSDVMNKEVTTIKPDVTVKAAAQIMSKEKIGSLLVVDKTKLAGIITERDVLEKVVSKAKDVNKTFVGEIMSKDVIFIEPQKDIDEAAQVMVDNQIKKLPVVYQHRLVGILTAMDIVTAEPKIMEQISSLVMLVKKKKLVAG
jgi:CBS domain-containing protein